MELLVIIGIITLLGALLFPIFNSARKKTQQTSCVTAMQQLSQALSMYTVDFDGMYPLIIEGDVDNNRTSRSAPVWADTLATYLQKDLPSCPAREFVRTSRTSDYSGDLIGYAINTMLNSANGTRQQYILNGRPENALRYPNCTIALLEARCGIYEALRPDTARSQEEIRHFYGSIYDSNNEYPFLQQTPAALRHNGGANYAFTDGHVQWFTPVQIAIEPQSDGIHPGFGL